MEGISLPPPTPSPHRLRVRLTVVLPPLISFFLLKMSSNLPVENLDAAVAAAASVVLETMSRQVGQRDISARELSHALIPVYGLTWNRAVINCVAKDSINNLFGRLRNSARPRAEYGRLSAFFKKAYVAACTFPAELGGWRILAERCRLEMSIGWPAILSAATPLAGKGIGQPLSLAAVPLSSVFALCEGSPGPKAIAALRGVSRSSLAEGSSVGHLIPPRKFLTRDSITLDLKRRNNQFQQS